MHSAVSSASRPSAAASAASGSTRSGDDVAAAAGSVRRDMVELAALALCGLGAKLARVRERTVQALCALCVIEGMRDCVCVYVCVCEWVCMCVVSTCACSFWRKRAKADRARGTPPHLRHIYIVWMMESNVILNAKRASTNG